jgi:hypothetical protein
LYISVYTIIIF